MGVLSATPPHALNAYQLTSTTALNVMSAPMPCQAAKYALVKQTVPSALSDTFILAVREVVPVHTVQANALLVTLRAFV